MSTATLQDSQANLNDTEVWAATTKASVWLWVEDVLKGNGAWKKERVGGPTGKQRIQITVRERRYNQEQIPDKNAHLDPFLNGLLTCKQGAAQSPNGYTDEQLVDLLKVDDDAAFKQVVESISSEILMRRLLGLAEKHALTYRYEMLDEIVYDRYRVGKTQRSLRDDIPDHGIGNGVLISR